MGIIFKGYYSHSHSTILFYSRHCLTVQQDGRGEVEMQSIFGILATIVVTVSLAGCSKLKAGDKFIVTTDGVEFQYEVILSRMNYVRVIPVSGAIPSSITIPSKASEIV